VSGSDRTGADHDRLDVSGSESPFYGETTYRLLCRARDGDSEALDRLCERFLPQLRAWAAGRLPVSARDAVDTEDIVQDVLARAISQLARVDYRQPHALQAYVRQMLANRLRDEVRRVARRPRRVEWPGVMPDGDASPLEAAIGRETLESYERALAGLAPADREAIVARVELGASYQEIADGLGKPTPDAARKTVTRALVRLAREMNRRD
jgi:RNA polymerase sigma-70 factor (ECF subfamily)